MKSATITAKQFAFLLDVSLWTLYQSVVNGTCPVEPIRVGERRLVWSAARVAELLGVESLEEALQLLEDALQSEAKARAPQLWRPS